MTMPRQTMSFWKGGKLPENVKQNAVFCFKNPLEDRWLRRGANQ